MNIAELAKKLGTVDHSIAITRAVAETIQCPEWSLNWNKCDTPDECFCRMAAERVERVIKRRSCGNE
jgi:hypothetical protein